MDLEKAFSLFVHVLKEAMIVPSTQAREPSRRSCFRWASQCLPSRSTQSDGGKRSAKPLVPAGSSLRRKVDKRTHYRMLKAAADDLDEELHDDLVEDETSEDEYSEDE